MVKILRIFYVPAGIRVNDVLELDVLPEEINSIVIFSHQTSAENIMQCWSFDIIGNVL